MSEIETHLHVDRAERQFTFTSVQDVEPILEHNKLLRTLDQDSDWGREVGEIPNIILHQWLNEEHAKGNVGFRLYSVECDELITRKLRDPEWAYLRTDKKKSIINGFLGFGS